MSDKFYFLPEDEDVSGGGTGSRDGVSGGQARQDASDGQDRLDEFAQNASAPDGADQFILERDDAERGAVDAVGGASGLGASGSGATGANASGIDRAGAGSSRQGASTGGSGQGEPPKMSDYLTDYECYEDGKMTLKFSGTGGELFRITIVNYLLTIVTLGIYHFWGKVRVRRFLWSRTQFMGEPFEYTGTGGELFVGFLVVAVLLFLASAAQEVLFIYSEAAATLLFPFLMLLIWPFAAYRAVRYRLTRTRWRGIRGNLDGKAMHFLWVATKQHVLSLITLGLWYPNAKAALVGEVVNNARFGSQAFQFGGTGKQIRAAYFKTWGMLLLGFGAYVGMMTAGFVINGVRPNPDQVFVPGIAAYNIVGIFLGLLIFWFAFNFLYVHVLRWQAANTMLGGLSFRYALRLWPFCRLLIGNLLLVVFTLGLGSAWAQVRYVRFLQKHLEVTGTPDFAAISQDTSAVPKRGEGFLEAFDVDLGI